MPKSKWPRIQWNKANAELANAPFTDLWRIIAGPDAPPHTFNSDGVCTRCGEDAEEWEAPRAEPAPPTSHGEHEAAGGKAGGDGGERA